MSSAGGYLTTISRRKACDGNIGSGGMNGTVLKLPIAETGVRPLSALHLLKQLFPARFLQP